MKRGKGVFKKAAIAAFALFAGLGFFLKEAPASDSIKMRIVVVNPSDTKTQVKNIKNYLPKEVKVEDVQDPGGLGIEYDPEQGMFYVQKEVELAPLETKTFEIVVRDVWFIPDAELSTLKNQVEHVLKALEGSRFYDEADLISKTIYGRLEEILRTQNDNTVTRQQHIAHYRNNLKTLDAVKADVARLEKLLVAVGGPPNLELIEESDINLKAPSSKTTWVIIFVVLIFIAILSLTFYFTWHRQAKITENIFSKEKDNSFSEFKGSSGEEPREKGPPGR